MTEDRIREKYDAWVSDVECTENERRFFSQYPAIDQPLAIGFYAGFRTAERLAKIEVLEELKKRFLKAREYRVECIYQELADMIEELKATN